MMEYRVVFRTGFGKKSKRMNAANPLAAINRVLNEWDNVHKVERIETIIETEAGETSQPTDFNASTLEQHIHVNVSK